MKLLRETPETATSTAKSFFNGKYELANREILGILGVASMEKALRAKWNGRPNRVNKDDTKPKENEEPAMPSNKVSPGYQSDRSGDADAEQAFGEKVTERVALAEKERDPNQGRQCPGTEWAMGPPEQSKPGCLASESAQVGR